MKRFISSKCIYDFKPLQSSCFDDHCNCHNPFPPRQCCDFCDFPQNKHNCHMPFPNFEDNNFCSPPHSEQKKCEPCLIPQFCDCNQSSLMFFVIGYLIGSNNR